MDRRCQFSPRVSVSGYLHVTQIPSKADAQHKEEESWQPSRLMQNAVESAERACRFVQKSSHKMPKGRFLTCWTLPVVLNVGIVSPFAPARRFPILVFPLAASLQSIQKICPIRHNSWNCCDRDVPFENLGKSPSIGR